MGSFISARGPPAIHSAPFARPFTDSHVQLFGFIAASIAGFLKLHPEYLPEPGQGPAPLAFTFSFPTQQDGLSSARLTNWTKGFSTQGVIGEDVGALLNTALEALVRADPS